MIYSDPAAINTEGLPGANVSANLPPDELLEPERKPKKNGSEDEPTEHIESPGEGEYVENVRQRRTNESGDVEISATVHAGASDGRVLIPHNRVTRDSAIESISRVRRCSIRNLTERLFHTINYLKKRISTRPITQEMN